ncbi:MAG: universal stress protein [Syntrophomonadaceae bacterium]|nr:universal stress protein [Syntrophomonadaceae bacterium]
MFKKILVSTDASEYSCHAFATAVDIAKHYNAEIVILHVVDKPDNFSYMGALVSGYALFSDEKISEIGHQVIADTVKGIDTSGVKMLNKVSKGYAAAEILREMENEFDLVIMGSRGHGPLKGALTGSVTLHVLAQAPCPVMVVK